MADHTSKPLISSKTGGDFEAGISGLKEEDNDPLTPQRRFHGLPRALLLVSTLVLAALVMGGGIRNALGGDWGGRQVPAPSHDAIVELDGGSGHCKFTVEFETMSGDIKHSGSGTGAKMSFLVDGEWTDEMWLFRSVGDPWAGASRGEIATHEFHIKDWPKEMKIIAGGRDALGYQRIDFNLPNGATVPIAHPEGIDLTYPWHPPAPSERFWVDGDQKAPKFNKFSVPDLPADFHCKFTVEFETMSGNIKHSGSGTGAKMSFFLDGEWTDEMWLFRSVGDPWAGASRGEIATHEFDIKHWPESMKIIAGGNDALGYQRIDFVLGSGIRVPIVHPKGIDLTYPWHPPAPSERFWVDGDQKAPRFNVFPVPQFHNCGEKTP